MEEEQPSESKVMRVGESECLREATAIKVGETIRVMA